MKHKLWEVEEVEIEVMQNGQLNRYEDRHLMLIGIELIIYNNLNNQK